MSPLEIEAKLIGLRRERRAMHPGRKIQRPADEQAEDLALLLSYALSRMRRAARSRSAREQLVTAIAEIRSLLPGSYRIVGSEGRGNGGA